MDRDGHLYYYRPHHEGTDRLGYHSLEHHHAENTRKHRRDGLWIRLSGLYCCSLAEGQLRWKQLLVLLEERTDPVILLVLPVHLCAQHVRGQKWETACAYRTGDPCAPTRPVHSLAAETQFQKTEWKKRNPHWTAVISAENSAQERKDGDKNRENAVRPSIRLAFVNRVVSQDHPHISHGMWLVEEQMLRLQVHFVVVAAVGAMVVETDSASSLRCRCSTINSKSRQKNISTNRNSAALLPHKIEPTVWGRPMTMWLLAVVLTMLHN